MLSVAPPGWRARCASCLRRRALSLLLALGPLVAAAAGIEARKGELHDLKSRIEALQRDMAAAEESRGSVVDQLRETETAISGANQRLHELGIARNDLRAQLAELEVQGQRLDRQTGTQQNQLARILNRQFVGGDADAMQLLLAGRDPNQSARDRYFLTQLSRAKADMIQKLRSLAEEKRRLAETTRQRQAELAEVERRQQEQRTQLVERKKQRAATLAAIGDRLKAQRRELSTLRRDEQRLAKLIEGLARIGAARKARPPAAGGKPPARGAPAKDYDPGTAGGAFAALRGKLRLPVSGAVTGRFGSPRAEGGATWKGVFIRAAEGSEVKAVAAGAVVFSDWLRGFGNLLIIDHGDDFLSVYGNNESLLATVGAKVGNGEAVATVGNSGGNPESGLYFELRHRGQPFDPLRWAGRH